MYMNVVAMYTGHTCINMYMNIVAMYTGHTCINMYMNVVAMYTGHTSYKYVYEYSCHVHRSLV